MHLLSTDSIEEKQTLATYNIRVDGDEARNSLRLDDASSDFRPDLKSKTNFAYLIEH